MKRLLKNTFRRLGYDLVRHTPERRTEFASVPDLAEWQKSIVQTARSFTMTSVERMVALIDATAYVADRGIPGDIAECGVWRGGSMMAVALTLLARGDDSRSLYLYDTFEGMSAPTAGDKDLQGVPAAERLAADSKGMGIWCCASIEDVGANLRSTGYPADRIHLIKGKVEDTIPRMLPTRLSLLRLDTDWYESTRHELRHLYPIVQAGGIVILDDYGHWQGARRAVDEFFAERGEKVYLHRIDYTGRLLIKGGA